MTFMFQYPQFVEIFLPVEVQKAYPKYTLYGYSEGGLTEHLRKMKFKGIPVLFVPGSSGSHKQGRSLASVSLRKSVNSRTPFHFNYFMIDFNEEQAAIFGGVLSDQTKFVSHCIKKILSLYQNNNEGTKPKSVILIGHSLGGILARGVFMNPDFNPNLVHLIITLASPHKYALIQFDSYISNYYKDVNNFWKNNQNLSHINLISLSGGFKDIIVHSDVTTDVNCDFNVVTTAVPGVWLPNDHLSIMWCKQLVLTIVRALFDSVDISAKQLSTDKEYVKSVFEYHLIKRSAGKKYSTSLTSRFSTFERNSDWLENLQRQFTVTEAQGVKKNHYIMIRLFSDIKSEMAFIEAYNINIRDWIFACSADLVQNSVRMCETGENLSNITEIAPVDPQLKLKRKLAHLNLFDLKAMGFSHVVVRIPPSDTYMSFNVDVFQLSDRIINIQVPKVYSVTPDTIISKTQDNVVFYSINLVGFEYIWQSYVLAVESLSCKTAKNNAVISFDTPWLNASQHFFFGYAIQLLYCSHVGVEFIKEINISLFFVFSSDKSSMSVTLSLASPKPRNFNSNLHPTVRMNLDPTCKYKVKIKPSIIGIFAQGARYYSVLLPAFVATVVILTVRQQLTSLETGKCSLFHSALSTAVRRYYVVLQATILGSKLLGFGIFLSLLPVPDFAVLHELNLDSFFLIVMLYGVAIMVTYLAGAGCYVAIVMSGQAAHKMALRFVAKTVSGVINWSEWIISALHQVPVIVSVTLISLSVSTCGALALGLGTLFYFLKLCKMYEEYLDDWFHYSINLIAKTVKKVVTKSSKKPDKKEEESKDVVLQETKSDLKEDQGESSEPPALEISPENSQPDEVDLLSAIHFHTSVFLVWLLTSLVYVPSALVWAKNYHYSMYLEKDSSVIPSIIVSACGAVLWQPSIPKKRKYSAFTSGALFALAISSIIYASVSLHRLGYILSASLVVVAVNQYVSYI
ncbi:hypothetical protein RUM43_004304 [Polyplax serrata]|uniref:GPI inositol-deacylase n=1 Tax=Polyplax serrata TaxID=468196 RepID=A0AAN8SBQ9_POLSC